MATSTITADQNEVNTEIFIAAPPERVFQAITDPAQTARWWGQSGLYRLTETKADVRQGGKWSSEGVGDDGTKFRVEGEYLEVNPPSLLVHTWRSSYAPSLNTIVRWELQPTGVHGLHPSGPRRAGTGTLVKVQQTGFAGDTQQATGHAEGWKRVLGWMLSFVERGETVETRKEP